MAEDSDAPADIPAEAGKRPRFAEPGNPGAAADVGTGDGYSGQEYDSAGQAQWRAGQQRQSLAQDGAVHGSGAGAGGGNPGEDYDADAPGGAAPPQNSR